MDGFLMAQEKIKAEFKKQEGTERTEECDDA
jgi:hypothetical protein